MMTRVDETTRMCPTFCIQCLIGHCRAHIQIKFAPSIKRDKRTGGKMRMSRSAALSLTLISVTEMSHFPISECIPPTEAEITPTRGRPGWWHQALTSQTEASCHPLLSLDRKRTIKPKIYWERPRAAVSESPRRDLSEEMGEALMARRSVRRAARR